VRPVATPCRSADIVRRAQRRGRDGDRFHRGARHNGGATRCTPSAPPDLLYRNGGKLVPGQIHAATPHAAIDGSPTMDPGEVLQLTIETYGGCLDGRPQITYPGRPSASDGTLLPLSLDPPLTRLRVGLTAVPTAVPGRGHHPGSRSRSRRPAGQCPDRTDPRVRGHTSTNPGSRDVDLQPCPNYLSFPKGDQGGGGGRPTAPSRWSRPAGRSGSRADADPRYRPRRTGHADLDHRQGADPTLRPAAEGTINLTLNPRRVAQPPSSQPCSSAS
jgi:hypothetical protein